MPPGNEKSDSDENDTASVRDENSLGLCPVLSVFDLFSVVGEASVLLMPDNPRNTS